MSHRTSHGSGALPPQPPSLKLAAGLAGDFEYAGIWTGQSNSLPWGYPSDAFQFALELTPQATGLDLLTVTIPDNAARAIGMVETLLVDLTVVANQWNTSTWLRLGEPDAPLRGYAQVVCSFNGALQVRWLSLPTNGPAVVAGYLVRENGKFMSYENARVLTPYLPLFRDIQPPLAGVAGTTWVTPKHSPYPVENGPVSADGKRLILPAPYTLPAAVTTFADLGLFLPITRREGSDGFGISEIADSTFDGVAAPTGHPIATISGQVFTFLNSLADSEYLVNGYLLVDWEQGGAAKRSWARIVSSAPTTFTTDAASWLGDAIPDTPTTSSMVTFTTGTNVVNWPAHTFVEGDRVTFDAVPPELTAGQVYYVRNPAAGTFQISVSMDHPVLAFSDFSAGTNGYRVWVYTAWIPHWRDNPFTWLPGPEFAYPNEDQQPRNVFVHFRARGLRYYAYNVDPLNSTVPFDGVADSRFGALLPFAWRTGAAIGKRMNIVALGIGSTPLVTSHTINVAAGIYTGVVGWWNYERFSFSLPLEDSESALSKRLKRLITFMAPQALLAEANVKLLRYVGACHIQGEADGFIEGGRENYLAAITDYKQWLRDLITGASLSPFLGEAKLPFVQPLITHLPYEVDPSGVITWTDVEGLVNNAIREAHTSDEYAGYVDAEDLPKINTGHYGGGGMAVLGARLSATICDVLEYALASTSATLSVVNPRLLRIANQALLYLGQGARPITSLTQTTTEAQVINIMLPEATQQLLSMRQWSWAMRREPASRVFHDNPRWLYAYVVPGRAITPIGILEPTDSPTSTALLVSTLSPGVQTDLLAETPTDEPPSFEIGRSPSGHRLLFTNVAQIDGDTSQQLTIPTAGSPAQGQGLNDLHPERLPRRPTLHYVDKVLDPDRYSPSFATALTWLLASMIAPALIKGEQGEVVATRCYQKAAGFLRTEAVHETVTRQRRTEHRPDWIDAR